jgi:hypothetical protein
MTALAVVFWCVVLFIAVMAVTDAVQHNLHLERMERERERKHNRR